jgi:hypothetical protein
MAKVLIWLASGDRNKLMPGLIWGLNAKRRGWVEEVRVVVFGESEKTLMEDDELYSMVHEIEGTTFCRHVAEKEGTLAELEKKGAKVVYVGEPIARAITEGYTVLTF